MEKQLNTIKGRWWRSVEQIRTWRRLHRLKRELRASQAFARECEALGCRNLAELERRHGSAIAARIARMEQ